MSRYDHRKIEKKWQKVWKDTDLYRIPSLSKTDQKKFYVLDMFPYPSGEGLHVGHPKGYIATDVVSRMKRMQGKGVLHPMGFDAFGLPAENYAIKTKTNPETAVRKNIARYKKQLEILGFDYDWSREINTTDPNYYKWTQWIFLQLFKKGLAYESNEPINWCPSDKTGLANEDVENGRCERCGAVVEKRPMRQWVLKITDYAERLLKDIEALNWPENIKEQQRNWIGKSEGSLIKFSIFNFQFSRKDRIGEIEIFTTRADTLFGATYLVLAPEHPLIREQILNSKSEILNKSEIQKYLNQAKTKTEIERTADGKEKTGVEIKGIKAVNPANEEEIPVWIADYVLSEYGTGAIMAVPAHDQRDFQFAKKYNLPVKMVVCPHYPAPTCPVLDDAYLDTGHLVDSGRFNGIPNEDAKKGVIEFVGGKTVTKYKLKDWVFSRQRYWGEPIPLIHCEKCGVVAVLEKDLPVKLPKVKSYEPTGTGESPLAGIEKWVSVKCPKCGGAGKRETNTMPQWAGSSWYYLAYITKKASGYKLSAKSLLAKWLPVDLYVGGAEHATRHLIYARFWHKFLYDIGIVATPEPFLKLQPVGLIIGEDGRKMSKRFGNVVNPDEIVTRFGADSLRIYEMFMGPFNQSIAWNMDSLVGARRFLERVYHLQEKILNGGKLEAKSYQLSASLLHQTIKKIGGDIESFKFNTAISALMILLNSLERETGIPFETFKTFIKLLAPFAPHLSEELWAHLGYRKSIHLEPWPTYSEEVAGNVPLTIIVQVNGKTRGSFEASKGEAKEQLREVAIGLHAVQKWTEGRKIKNIVVVLDRLVNIVV